MTEATDNTVGETKPRTQTRTVVSNKMDNTVSDRIARYVKHPLYRKNQRRSKKLLLQDEDNSCQECDEDSISESRPYSKSKAWKLVEVLERAEAQ